MEDLNVLVERLTGKDEPGAEAAALQLAEAGPEGMTRIEPLLRSEDQDHRWWAIRTLAAMEDPDSESSSPALREARISAVEKQGRRNLRRRVPIP